MAKIAVFLAAALAIANGARIVEIASNGFPKTIISSDVNDAVKITDEARLVPKRESVTAEGTRKVRYEQLHMGVPVYGSVVTAEHGRNGALTGKWRGQIVADIEVTSAAPAVQPIEAFMVLRRAFAHDLIRPSSVVFSNEQAILQIYVGPDEVARLAYLTSYVIEQSDEDGSQGELPGVPARPFGFVDAKTGELLLKWDGMSHNVATTIAAISGNQGSYGKRTIPAMRTTVLTDGVTCRYNTSRVQVLNMKNRKVATFTPSTFPCREAISETYDFVNGGYSALNDAAHFAEISFDMFQAYTGHYGPLNRAPLKARVHYGSRYENAFWDGTYMTIGDG